MEKKRAMITVDAEQWESLQQELKDRGYPPNAMSFYLGCCLDHLEHHLTGNPSAGVDPFFELEIHTYGLKTARQQRIKADEELQRQKQEAESQLTAYYKPIASLFDRYTAAGLNRNQAIKQIGADLRKEKHPWSSPDLIRPSLVAAGRSGRPGRPRRKS